MNPVLQPDLVHSVTLDVWSQFLGIPLASAASAGAPADCAASIAIEGAWNGAVVIACSQALARRAAAAMFGCPLAEVDEAAWRDTLNEVANIMGGNLKSLLPGPSRLGLPQALGPWTPGADGAAAYVSDNGPLYIAIAARPALADAPAHPLPQGERA